MKNNNKNNNNNNRYQKTAINKLTKSNNLFNNKSNNDINPKKSYKDFSTTLSNLSSSIETKFNTINNIRDSKIVKIKNITKKNAKPIQNIIQPTLNIKKKEKEKEIIEDNDSSDYANPDDDDFNNILRESISMKKLNESKIGKNPFNTFNTIDNKKLIKPTENIDKNKNEINNLEKNTYNKLNEYFKNDYDYNNKYKNKQIKEQELEKETKDNNNNKTLNNLIFENPYPEKNKSIEINNFISPEKKDIIPNKNNSNNNKNLNSITNEDYNDYNLLENNNIFNNNSNNILYIPSENSNRENVESNEINIEENPEFKTCLINHNLYIDKKLKEMKFFEKLKSISDARYLFFIKNYRKDDNFIAEENFENILISENDLQIQSPLTLIFQKIFSPFQDFLEKNFFQKNFTSGVNMNYVSDYNDYELNNVPRFFNDLSYVNNLFNTFNFDELNNFLEEIKTWKNTFTYKQEYNHPLINFKQDKYVTLINNLTTYFISPYDLIIEFHLKSSGITFSDAIMAINQFIFHCDIDFDTQKGRFLFKTNVKILNTIKLLKNTAINNTIKEEGKNENDEEIINNIWIPMKKEILEKDLINQKNQEIIYKQYIKNNINKTSDVPKSHEGEGRNNKKSENSSEDAWDSFSDKNNEKDFGEINDDINNLYINKNEWNERNVKVLKSGGLFLIGLYLLKIYFSSFSIDTIFGIFWISLIGYLIYRFR